MEHLELGPGGVPTYCGVHSRRYVYIDYATAKKSCTTWSDPFQITNVVGSRAYADVLHAERGRLQQLCRPRPPGFESGTEVARA